jgi:hypothetical protein
MHDNVSAVKCLHTHQASHTCSTCVHTQWAH